MKKVSYTLIQKNKSRPNPTWYIRERRNGKVTDVNLQTTDRSKAEAELLRVKLAQSENAANPIDALAVRRNAPTERVTAPNGVLDRWEVDMRVRGLSETSIAKYTRAARFLLANEAVSSLSPDRVRVVMARTANLANNTRRSYCNALASLFEFLRRPDLVDALPHVRPQQTDRPWWTEDEMMSIIDTVKSDTPERTREYKEYFTLMAAVGSRQGETAQLRWCDLRDGAATFRASTTKSHKSRIVPIPYSLWLRLDERRDDVNPEELVFPYVGRANQATRFAVLARAVKRLGLRGGLHTFRHSTSMLLYQRSRDIKAVSQILGHSPAVALQYYQHARSESELRSIVERDMFARSPDEPEVVEIEARISNR